MNLRLHNICWSRRHAVWCRYAGGGWWGRGSIVSPDMRGFYEKFLPFNEFRHSLITIGEQILESPDWVPNILHSNDILSLPDFWAMLPDAFAGRVTFKEDELFPLFCAIADPSRFGTADNRYPKQLQQIGDFIKNMGGSDGVPAVGDTIGSDGVPAVGDTIGSDGVPAVGNTIGSDGVPAVGDTIGSDGVPAVGNTKGSDGVPAVGNTTHKAEQGRAVRILDLGCGVGLGTCELAQIAAAVHGTVVGITSEHLEVWMARHRRLPHDATREKLFHRYPTTLPVTFTYGFAESYRDGSQYDVIVCNGLAGGRFLNAAPQLTAFLETCDTLLASHGKMFIANRFHEGERPGVERLRRLACQSGWSVEGHWQSLVLSRGNGGVSPSLDCGNAVGTP